MTYTISTKDIRKSTPATPEATEETSMSWYQRHRWLACLAHCRSRGTWGAAVWAFDVTWIQNVDVICILSNRSFMKFQDLKTEVLYHTKQLIQKNDIYNCIYIHMCVCVCVYVYVYIYIYVYMCVYACIYICIHVCVCVYIYICIHVCVCVYKYIYVHVCVLTHVHNLSPYMFITQCKQW